MSPRYPSDAAERDAWILGRRVGVPRVPLDPRRPFAWLAEEETDAAGRLRPGLTLFLTNRECPWRCLMCDLWRYTLTTRVQEGDIPAQMDVALAEAAAGSPRAHWIKLYNAGSFFDPGAIPPADWSAIVARTRGIPRVIVENHPALTDRRLLPFRDALDGAQLEVAMGLETAHPEVLERLNKRITRESFQRAAEFLGGAGVELRVFVLIRPPFLEEAAALEWACRSIDFAFDCGAKVVSLIPTRPGNGAMEALAAQGDFSSPSLATVEAVHRYGLACRRGRVFVDLWDLEKAVSDPAGAAQSRARLTEMNRRQTSDG